MGRLKRPKTPTFVITQYGGKGRPRKIRVPIINYALEEREVTAPEYAATETPTTTANPAGMCIYICHI
jgi:hypothetical protein